MEEYRTKKELGKKRIVFITATRADFGKIKSLLGILNKSKLFDVRLFATGMHMLSQYGYTVNEIEKCNFPNIYKFINSSGKFSMGDVLANTLIGLGNYLNEFRPDMIVVHGDRIEALAGALSGALNNIIVAHIEGGEISGTIDEHIRHAISKISHLHFVANEEAKNRLIQMGELPESVYIVGSPDIDIMNSEKLPSLNVVRKRYNINFYKYGIMIYHPVTTEISELERQTNIVANAAIRSKKNFIVIHPNNDAGTDIIQRIYMKKLSKNKNIKTFPSVRFEYFLTLLKNADFMLGNSSAGIREAPFYGVPSINIGTRQLNRAKNEPSIFNCNYDEKRIRALINRFSSQKVRFDLRKTFGGGASHINFLRILKNKKIWSIDIQKQFRDLNFI